MQRLRVKFSRGEEIKFISHLDIMRLWERVFHRAGIELAYSEGFSPHPRISLAVPLAVGVTSEAELMDVVVARMVTPHWFTAAVSQQLPSSINIMGVYQIAQNVPSLQSQVRFAEYKVELDKADGPADIESAISTLLSAENLPWHHHRDTGKRSYDLRALIEELCLVENNRQRLTLEMKLRCDSRGAGRPEQVALALGFASHPHSVHRIRLILAAGKQAV